MIREEERRAVWDALAELPESDREVLMLRYIEQLPFAEIATILGITENTARVRHYRALQKVGPLLGGDLGRHSR